MLRLRDLKIALRVEGDGSTHGGVTATAKKGGDDVSVAAHLVYPDNVDNGNALAADATKIVEH